MKFNKKVIGMIATVTTTMTLFSGIVLAGSSSKSATGYGTLYGSTSSSSRVLSASTRISKNPDNAYVTLELDAQTSSGSTALDYYYGNSDRGETSYYLTSARLESHVYKIFGSHGVQGGSRYSSAVVYTVNTIS